MQLAKHIAQGNLLYLSQSNQRLSVSENAYYRWLAFASPEGEQVIQSVMLKRKPWRLTLPHQTALMLPLLFFKPNRIVELGLGGGNIQRFISHLSSAITIDSVEHYSEVIDCFNQGNGWLYQVKERNISLIKHSKVAFFDEILENQKYGFCRGSGVLIQTEQGWKISQYNLSFLVPNGVAKTVVEQIKHFKQEP